MQKNFECTTCKECEKRFEFPNSWCCLAVCGDFPQCEGCKKGMYLKKEDEK